MPCRCKRWQKSRTSWQSGCSSWVIIAAANGASIPMPRSLGARQLQAAANGSWQAFRVETRQYSRASLPPSSHRIFFCTSCTHLGEKVNQAATRAPRLGWTISSGSCRGFRLSLPAIPGSIFGPIRRRTRPRSFGIGTTCSTPMDRSINLKVLCETLVLRMVSRRLRLPTGTTTGLNLTNRLPSYLRLSTGTERHYDPRMSSMCNIESRRT